ncbi:MAG: rod shape-determining protein RodA [Actinomycetota bacterium]
MARKLSASHPIKHIDWTFVALIIALAAYGALFIYSATAATDGYHFLRLQIGWIIVGLLGMAFMASFDYLKLRTYSGVIYGAVVVLLILVFIIGQVLLGAQRWIPLGPFTLQPSELAKLALIIMLATLLSKRKDAGVEKQDFFVALGYTGLYLILVFIQPDLGTALVFAAIMFGMMFAAGVNLWALTGLGTAGVLGAILAVKLNILHQYQVTRLLVFLNPQSDPTGAGYNITQSKIAVGSGQLFGRGLFLGSQTRLNFIPHGYADFIFAVLSEQLGFLGGLALIVLFSLLLWRILKIARDSRDLFGTLLCVGVLSSFLFQAFVNIGMNIGIMPVTGIPLPLISYGGSSFLATMMSLGLVLNVAMRKYGGVAERAQTF